jgi:hypothetical protein
MMYLRFRTTNRRNRWNTTLGSREAVSILCAALQNEEAANVAGGLQAPLSSPRSVCSYLTNPPALRGAFGRPCLGSFDPQTESQHRFLSN